MASTMLYTVLIDKTTTIDNCYKTFHKSVLITWDRGNITTAATHLEAAAGLRQRLQLTQTGLVSRGSDGGASGEAGGSLLN